MARLQLLYLPGREADGVREQPFAMIVDEHAPPPRMIRVPEPVIPGIDPPTPDPATTGAVWPLPDRLLWSASEPDEFTAAWRQFATDIGAAGVLVTSEHIDLVTDDTDNDRLTVEFDSTELAKSIAHAMRGHLETAAGTATREWLDRHVMVPADGGAVTG